MSFDRVLFSLGIFVHLVLFFCIFEIYYSSPLVKGARPIVPKGVPPADRVVIFSADGLRARSFYDHPDNAPFLHGIIQNGKCSWGISQSHVPTESRPGHVAMLAGFYEDVSAVTRGWKHNPVPFDSVFNQSRYSWLWGSPDIVPMFGDGIQQAYIDSYSHAEEDFASKDAALLDKWVFDKVRHYFDASHENNMVGQLKSSQTIFFLHLLGLDTNGHGNKPYSREYFDNIRTVDNGIKEIVELFENFYADNRTAYVFSADHGMTDWGSHGAGTPDEIETPFVFWGAGIAQSKGKHIINQVDMAPLISSLIGIAIPMNSVGILPMDLLDVQPKTKYQAACSNLKQHYSIKREERRKTSLPMMFRDYPLFGPTILQRVNSEVSRLVDSRRFDAAAALCWKWIPGARDALLYFHRLGLAMATLFLSWNALLYLAVPRRRVISRHGNGVFVPRQFPSIVLVIVTLLLFYQNMPLTNFVYYLLPLYIITININVIKICSPNFFEREILELYYSKITKQKVIRTIFYALVFFMSIGFFVIAFYERAILSVIIVVLGFLPFVQKIVLYPWNLIWLGICLILAIFPQLEPVGKSPNLFLVVISPILAGICSWFYASKLRPNSKFPVKYFSLIHFFVAGLVLYSNLWFQYYQVVPIVVRLSSWMSLPLAFILPILTVLNFSDRLFCWFSSLYIPYSLLSLSHESLFVFLFGILLFIYVRFEFAECKDSEFFQTTLSKKRNEIDNSTTDMDSAFELKEWRRALALFAFIEIAFFGTGNIASLNSFNPSFIRNFITVFSPFTMAALLLFKIFVPFAFVACGFAAVLHLDERIFSRLCVLLMIITNFLSLAFFFMLKDQGSWLDIGISISNYVISMVTSSVMFLLLRIANKLMKFSIMDHFMETKYFYLKKT